ncbi:hypothetical protein PHO31112_05357 [Pandoraea horticolens]|uniref:Uncharacterized protein n=1 Tax=Pandoraea horticolens TaxID=2508298 RepID=A0A5E4ZDP4_9BURK|nr:hypothetical protein PHO31112_05357 [Pandoraea horticolens]
MNISKSEPDSFRTGLAIAFTAEETAQLGDQAKHLVKLGLVRLLGLSEQVCAARISSTSKNSSASRHDQEQRQSAFEPLNRAQLQGLNAATVLQHIEQNLDFPARPVPVNEFGGLLQCRSSLLG